MNSLPIDLAYSKRHTLDSNTQRSWKLKDGKGYTTQTITVRVVLKWLYYYQTKLSLRQEILLETKRDIS